MRIAKLLRHVEDIGHELGRNSKIGITRADFFDIVRPALLHDLQPAAERRFEQPKSAGNDLAKNRRPLTSAGHEDAERRSLVKRRERHLADFRDRLAHRVADQHELVTKLRSQPLDLGKGCRNRRRPSGEHAVDAAEHRILLVKDARNPHRTRCEERRERRIAAEADDGIGPVVAEDRLGLAPSGEDRQHRPRPAQRIAAELPCGEHVHRDLVEQARDFRTAGVGDHEHAVAASGQLCGKRVRRDHVPASSTGGQDEIHAVSASPLHFTT
jgi:hypothetical protein